MEARDRVFLNLRVLNVALLVLEALQDSDTRSFEVLFSVWEVVATGRWMRTKDFCLMSGFNRENEDNAQVLLQKGLR